MGTVQVGSVHDTRQYTHLVDFVEGGQDFADFLREVASVAVRELAHGF